MSARGRLFFDRYVATYLNGPLSHAFSIQSHAYTLRSLCRDEGISANEIIEEVGELMAALAAAREKP